MKIDCGFLTILYFSAIVLGLFSGMLLLLSVKNKTANRLLALLMLAITGWLIDAFFRVSDIYGQNSNLYFLPIYYSLAFGPLLYFYVQAITNMSFHFKSKYLLHFILVFIQAAFYWIVVFQSYESKYQIWFNLHMPYTYRLEYDGTWVSLVIYLWLSIKLIKKYQLWLNNNYSNVTRNMLSWLKVCLFIIALICISWFFEAALRDAKNIYYKYDYSGNMLCIVIFILGIFSYRQANIDLSFKPDNETTLSKTSVTADDAIVKKIETAMQKGRLYLNPELTLADLAKHLHLPAKTVSANINAAYSKPFNSYVNTWRVNEVKRRFEGNDLQKLTLLGIAYEAGFNSKTSFNRIFKEFTGLSPSDYLKK